MALEPLENEGHVEHGVGVTRIGLKRAIEAGNRLLGAALIIQHIREVVPGLSVARIGFHGGPIGRLRFEAPPGRTQDVAEVERRRRVGRIQIHRASIKSLRGLNIARLFGRLGIFEDNIGVVPRPFDVKNELAGFVGAALHLLDENPIGRFRK